MENGLENAVTPLSKSKKITKSGGVRKFLGSVGKGMDRFMEWVTPSKSTGKSKLVRVIKASDITNNFTIVNSNDPDAVLEEIKQALKLCGFECKNKKSR